LGNKIPLFNMILGFLSYFVLDLAAVRRRVRDAEGARGSAQTRR
jgi:hypothetical protein